MFLTKKEVAELTGYRKPSVQIKWLQVQQFGFTVGGDAPPKSYASLLSIALEVRPHQKKP